MSGEPRLNAVKREMIRLQVDPFSVYNPYREKNPAVAILAEQLMQGHLAERLITLINSPLYQSANTEQQKAYLVGGNAITKKANIRGAKDYITAYRAYARETLASMASYPEYEGDFMSYTKGRLNAMGPAKRGSQDILFEAMSVGTRWEGKTLEENLEAIDSDPSLVDEGESKEYLKTNLIHQYLLLK
jgi:hypothetical protein